MISNVSELKLLPHCDGYVIPPPCHTVNQRFYCERYWDASWRLPTIDLWSPGSNLQQHIPQEALGGDTLTHARRNWSPYACHLSNVLIQHDKTSVIYKVIERKVFWSTSPSIMSRQQAVKLITVRSGLLFTARLHSALWSAGIMWLLFEVCSIKNTFYLQDNRCWLGRECVLMKSWFMNASCLDWGLLLFLINKSCFVLINKKFYI